MAQVDLARCRGREDFERRLADRAESMPTEGPDAWLVGQGWLETDWGGDLPDASWLNACGDRPVACLKHDRHAVLVNEVVLKMLGEVECPPGGEIVRDASGQPPGLMLEAAAWHLVNPIIPKPSIESRRHTTIAATRHL